MYPDDPRDDTDPRNEDLRLFLDTSAIAKKFVEALMGAGIGVLLGVLIWWVVR